MKRLRLFFFLCVLFVCLFFAWFAQPSFDNIIISNRDDFNSPLPNVNQHDVNINCTPIYQDLQSELKKVELQLHQAHQETKIANQNIQKLQQEKLFTKSATAPPDNSQNICNLIPSTPKDWTNRLQKILEASHDQEFDPKYKMKDFNAQGLEFITPRLLRSISRFPQHHLDRLLQRIQGRYDYLQNPDFSTSITPPPPIQIYVSGGSVAEGQNCKANIPGNRIVGFSKCSWPRLEQLVNNLVGGPLIKIYNGARGGANSQVGRALLHYLPPHGDSYYDLIINAHSVNDQHVLTMIEAGLYNTSLAGYQLAMAENFTRAVMASEENTILIWLEDYLGNEQRSILDLQDYFSKTIHLLSNYYGFGVVSYSNAVRDIVYGDTTASALTPVWYNSQKEMKREVHPGIIMHACTTYILLYYMWNMLLQACAVSGNDQATTLSYNSTKADLVTKAKWPQPIPKGLPPRLTSDLSLENISDLWRRDYTATTNTNISIRGDASCPFRWTVGVEKPLDLASLEKTSRDIFEPFLQKPTTWQLTQSDFGKGRFGWAHYIQNHTSKQQPLVLELPFEGIQSIGLFVARSIDPQWVNSTALVTIWDDQQRLIKKQIIAGYHPSTTSGKIIKRLISFAMTKNVYLEEIDLSPSNAKFVRFQLEHVSGFGFKFMGMIMCRYPIMGMQLPLSINNHLG